MSLVDSTVEPFSSVIRHHEYYIANGDLSFLVDQVQFRVHKYFFERESSFFAARLSVPAAAGKPPQGTPSTPIIIKDVTPHQFASFLWVFYNPHYSIYEAPANVWGDILRLAHLWSFPNMKALCIRELETKEMLDVKRVKLYHDNDVDRNLLIPRYAALCARDEPLTYAEGLDLGIQVALQIAAGRERIRSFISPSGERTPLTPTVRGDDLTGYIRELFNVEQTGVTPPSYTSEKEKEGEASQAGGLSTAPLPASEDEPAQVAPPVLVKPPVNPTQTKKDKEKKKKEGEQPDQQQQPDSATQSKKSKKKKATKGETPAPGAEETRKDELEAPPVADSATLTEPIQLPADETLTQEPVTVLSPLKEVTSEFPSLDTAEALPVTSTESVPSESPAVVVPPVESLVDGPPPATESLVDVPPVVEPVVGVPPVVPSPESNPIESTKSPEPATPVLPKSDEATPSTEPTTVEPTTIEPTTTQTDAPPAPPAKPDEEPAQPPTPSVSEKANEPPAKVPFAKRLSTAGAGGKGRHSRNASVVTSPKSASSKQGEGILSGWF